MKYSPQVFMKQFPILKQFVHHFVYYRALLKEYQESQQQNEFWTLTIDAHLLQAVNHWCMVFGADRCNPTHWKHLSPNQSEELLHSFRDSLFQDLKLNEQAWNQYWKEVVDFRNNYASHRALELLDPVPYLETALQVVHHYDKWIREIIYPDTFAEPPLEIFSKSLTQSTALLVSQLMQVTATCNNQ